MKYQILLISHHDLCIGLKNSAKMIIGDNYLIDTISLDENGIASFQERLTTYLNQALLPVLIMSDIPGGTPYNEALNYNLQNIYRNNHLISGTNLSMVIEACLKQNKEIEVVQDDIIYSGIESINYKIESNDDNEIEF